MSRSAWVIHMSAVTLAQITRNAPSVVRKIYRPMDPIDLRVPARGETSVRRAPHARPAPLLKEPLFFTLYLIWQQSGLAKAKPLTMHNKTLIGAVCLGGHRALPVAPPSTRRRSLLGQAVWHEVLRFRN